MQINQEYSKRIDRVIDYLRDNLDRPSKLADLAKVACFSEFHFHRIFGSVTGETLNGFTNRLRLEKSARMLSKTNNKVTDIALECGFSSSATFARSFKNAFDTTPTQYRKTGKLENSKICKELFPCDEYHLPMSEDEKRDAFPVRIETFPEWKVAYLRISRAFEGNRVLNAFEKMIGWLRENGLYDRGTLFGMSMDDPKVTPKHLYTYEVCFASEVAFETPVWISRTVMPERAYCVARVHGDMRMVGTAWDYLFRGWLIRSEYEPEHAPALEILLDKDKALDWSHFDLDLAIPVKKLKRK
ncbi:MAG: AraC family transcriptional regulator [Pyrinomonadaceae bacterium]